MSQRFDKYHSAGWLAGTEIGITPLDAEHTAPATHKDYSDWPRHSVVGLYYDATNKCKNQTRKPKIKIISIGQDSAGLWFTKCTSLSSAEQ